MRRRFPDADRAVVLALVSRLLRYPDEELTADLPVLADAAAGLPREAGEPLLRLCAHLGRPSLLELQAEYVATFDLRRRNCLYLTYFAGGDTRRRGLALWRFADLYRRRGSSVAEGELADFLPALLELAAQSPDDAEPLDALVAHQAAISVLGRSLADDRSPWADAVAALERVLPRPSPAAAAAAERLLAEGPPAEQVGLEPYDPAAQEVLQP